MPGRQDPMLLTQALDALHPPSVEPCSPRADSDADRISVAALVLLAVMRVVPEEFAATRLLIDPRTGGVVLGAASLAHAEILSERLGLQRRGTTELDDMVLCHRWAGPWPGPWHGCPVTLVCYVVPARGTHDEHV